MKSYCLYFNTFNPTKYNLEIIYISSVSYSKEGPNSYPRMFAIKHKKEYFLTFYSLYLFYSLNVYIFCYSLSLLISFIFPTPVQMKIAYTAILYPNLYIAFQFSALVLSKVTLIVISVVDGVVVSSSFPD